MSSLALERKFLHRQDERDHSRFFHARKLSRISQGKHVDKSDDRNLELLPAHHSLLSTRLSLPVWDQGDFGSCTAHATCLAAYIVLYEQWTAATPPFDPSRLYAYAMTRMYAHDSLAFDRGAHVFDACNALERARIAADASFPYDRASELITQEPPLAAALSSAQTPWTLDFDFSLLQSNVYNRMEKLNTIRAALADDKPVVIGFSVYKTSMDNVKIEPYVLRARRVPEVFLGGHCVCLVGYDDTFVGDVGGVEERGAFRARNSWGTSWGDGGDFWITYEFMLQGYAFDFYSLSARIIAF